MDQIINISKKAVIARVNELRKRAVVDMRHAEVKGETKLIMIFEDGSQEIFKGLRAA